MTEIEQYEMYDEMLDDVYGEIEICGYKYSASNALKSTDPIAYRVGFSDWTAALEENE